MRIKNLSLLLIGSLVISGVTAVNKEKAVAGETLRTKNIVADVKPGSVRSRNVLMMKYLSLQKSILAIMAGRTKLPWK